MGVRSIRRAAVAGIVCVAALASGCTLVKPVVCTFTYPIDEMSASLAAPHDDSEDYAQIPPPLLFATAPILIPLRFVTLSIMGAAGGLVSGFATDLNVVIWNFDEPLKNLTRPFRTNAKKPE